MLKYKNNNLVTVKKVLLFLVLFLTLGSCVIKIPLHSFEKEVPKTKPNYSNINYWAAHPGKFDYSDFLPKNLENDSLILDSIDVFYVYPTMYNNGLDWNASVEDKKLNKKIGLLSLKNQANVFAGMASVYSPFYRQMHLNGYKDEVNGIKAFNLAYKDIENAFKYYLENFNKGNRIVLAGHSQGTHHLQKLFNDYISINDSILEKIELCYFVGDLYVSSFSIKNYPICTNPTDLNCYLNWNSYPIGTNFSQVSTENKPVTNPITWINNDSSSTYTSHKGILFNNFKIILTGNKLKHANTIRAKTNNGLLLVEIQEFPLLKIYDKILNKNYHSLDYNLFWMNIRENFYLRMKKK